MTRDTRHFFVPASIGIEFKFRCDTFTLLASLITDPGLLSSVPPQPHTFVEIDHEMFPTVIPQLPLTQEELLSVTSKSMCELSTG